MPALLSLVGHRIKPAKTNPVSGGLFARIARAVQDRPLLTLLFAASTVVVLALPVLDLRLAQVDARLLPAGTQTRQLHDVTATNFPQLAGPNPIVVAVAAPAGSVPVAELRSRISAVPHVTGVEAEGSGPVTGLRASIDGPT